MNEYLEQIAKLLVNSADVPTDAQDVADEVAIVQTVKWALEALTRARAANADQRSTIDGLSVRLEECRKLNGAGQAEIERLNDQIQNWHIGASELQDKLSAAMRKIDALEMDKKNADVAIDAIARQRDALYERNRGVLDAFRVVVGEMIEVSK
jgi:chromosome segregation ATPase